MKIFFSFAIAVLMACIPCARVAAQTLPISFKNADVLRQEEIPAIVVKREVIPGAIVFTRQNGCSIKNPIYKNFLDDGTILESYAQLAVSGNSVPQWINEYRKPWKSELTDYEGGEYKMMLLQFGQHLPTIIKVEESDKKLLNAQAICAVAAYKIFVINLNLLKPLPEQRQDALSLLLKDGWSTNFSD